MVLPDSHEISRAPCYLGSPPGGRTISSTGLPPSTVRLSIRFDYDTAFSLHRPVSAGHGRSHNPTSATPDSFHTPAVWPHPLSLATTHGISLPVGTEMFHFPTFPPHTLYIQVRVPAHDCRWVPPFGHPRITARLPAPRGLSQATTSFFGSWCQGIHPVPLKTSTITTQIPREQTPATHPKGHATDRVCRLEHLEMLASTVQFSSNKRTHQNRPRLPTPPPHPASRSSRSEEPGHGQGRRFATLR